MDIETQDLQEIVVAEDREGHSDHNILVPSLNSISAHIARQVEQCQTRMNAIPAWEVEAVSPASSNEYGDHKSNMFGSHKDQCVSVLKELGLESNDDWDLEMGVPQSHRINIETWFPDNYESPIASPCVSPISHLSQLSNYGNMFGLNDDEGDDEDTNDYNNYFNWEHEEPPSPGGSRTIFDMLSGIQDFKKQVLGSINPKYLKRSLLYLCRINVPQEDNTYNYIVGFTKDLENVLETIDDTYACEWKMEILTLAECKSQNEEVKVKYELLQKGCNIDNNLYVIDDRVYNHMSATAEYVNPFYAVDADGNETYLGKKIEFTEHTSEHLE